MSMNTGKENADKSGLEKKNMPGYLKYGLIALAVVAVIVVGLIIALSKAGTNAASIGGQQVGLSEFKFYLSQQKAQMLQNAGNPQDEKAFWQSKIDGKNAFDVAKDKTLESLQEFKIQVMKAKEQKIVLEDADLKQIDDAINQIVQENGGTKIKANQAVQEKYGISLDDIRNLYRDSYLIQKMQAKQIEGFKVTDEDLKKEFDKDPKPYDTVTVRHILYLYGGKDGKRSKEESKKLADDMLAKVKAGEDMTELAKKNSEDTGVTENQGQYSFNKYGSYVPEFKDWALKATVGDSAIVETTYGYHVMKLEKRESTKFDDVKDDMKNDVIQTKYKALLDSWKKDPKYAIQKNTSVLNSITPETPTK